MDISQLANTFLLLNMRENNINYVNIIMLMSVIYCVKYFSTIYCAVYDYFYKYFYKKCVIELELKIDNKHCSKLNSPKVLGLIFYINKLKLPIQKYEEVRADFELKDEDETYEQINSSHLIPKLKNEKITDDIYVTMYINKELKSGRKRGGHRRSRMGDDDDDDGGREEEIKVIYVQIACYKNNIEYLKNFVDKCELDYLNFFNRNSNKQYIFTTKKTWDSDTDSHILLFMNYKFSSFKTFDNLFFEDKNKIIKRIDNYTNNIQRYKQLGIAHTLGFLFHGVPGTGKTSTIKAIANYTNRSLVSVNMRDIVNISSLYKLFSAEFMNGLNIKAKKRIYVFEEIDCYDCFLSRDIRKEEKSENKNDIVDVLSSVVATHQSKRQKRVEDELKEKLTLGQVLEVLDGIIENDDRICIFTTNHIEKIDKALLRPGRIDLVVEFNKLRKCDINSLYRLWYGEPISNSDLNSIKDYVISQAEFGKLCFENIDNPKRVIKELQKL